MNRCLRNCSWTVVVAIGFGAALAGCQSTPDAMSEVSPGEVALCSNCGEIKGTMKCCSVDAVTCAYCSLAKGSPGCCRMEKGTSEKVALCTKCGQFKGTAICCQKGAATCSKCGLVKGAPGCCKIPASSS